MANEKQNSIPGKKANALSAHLILHLVVFLWGFTAILGKLVNLSAESLVWYRFIVAITTLFFYIKNKKINLKLTPKQIYPLFGVGFIIAIHWVTFYHAIKISNISITLVCLSSGTLFTAFLEPLFFKRKLYMHELIFGVIIVLSLALIFKIESTHALGMTIAIFSAFTSSVFLVINGKLTHKYNASVMSFYEMLGGWIGLTLFLAFFSTSVTPFALPQPTDIPWLLILGIVCTAFTFVASTFVMKTISPFTVMIAIMLEPIYGIVLAYFIFGSSEHMSTGFYWGAFLILITLFANVILKKRISARLNLEVLT